MIYLYLIIIAWATGNYAKSKGQSYWPWFFLGLFTGGLAILFLFAVSNKN